MRREPTVDPAGLPANLHPVLRRVYAARGVHDALLLERRLDRLAPYRDLAGVDRAVAVLARALRARRRILVIGDFDADGATASAVAVRVLRGLGADVDYLVPNRFEYGYGLTPEIVAAAARRDPGLIVTVDNGVSSAEGVAAAHDRGIEVLITDHHLPGAELPDAEAIVNPNIPGDAFPSKHLAGVGVVFYVLLALRAHLREAAAFAAPGTAEPNMAALLDLVALGTVADVVTLDANNRILVEQGLRRIRAGECQPGVSALLEVAGRDPGRAVAADLGFAAAPRLNAAGRLEDMALGIECLLANDRDRARALAAELDALNSERRDIEAQMQAQALAEIERLEASLAREGLPLALCLFDPQWHQGVIGLVASRLKEHAHRPVIAFAPDGDGRLRGSARSVPGLHVRDALDAVAARHPGLIERFGGHAMAAGLSLVAERLEPFRAAFEDEVGRWLSAADLEGIVHSDGELAPGELGLELAETLRAAGPWGAGFPEPVFDGVFEVCAARVVGERHLKLTVRPQPRGRPVDAIAFNRAEGEPPAAGDRVRVAYRLDVNLYRGLRSVQLIVEHLEPA